MGQSSSKQARKWSPYRSSGCLGGLFSARISKDSSTKIEATDTSPCWDESTKKDQSGIFKMSGHWYCIYTLKLVMCFPLSLLLQFEIYRYKNYILVILVISPFVKLTVSFHRSAQLILEVLRICQNKLEMPVIVSPIEFLLIHEPVS